MNLIVENGSIVLNANCYVSLNDALAYLSADPFAGDFTSADQDDQEQAIAYAARVLDRQFSWRGHRVKPDVQPMQWPRVGVAERDRVIPRNEIPRLIVEANCLIALSAFKADSFFALDPAQGGADQIAGISLGQGAVKLDYQTRAGTGNDRNKTLVGPDVLAMLEGLGEFLHGRGVVKLRRG